MMVIYFFPVKDGSLLRAAVVAGEDEFTPSDLFGVKDGLFELLKSLIAIAEVTG